jgi:hypothetical protein
VAGVAPVGLRASFGSAPCARLRGLGQEHGGAGAPQLLHHEPPARGRFNGRLDPPAIPALEKATQAVAVGGRDPPALHLAGGAVERVEGDLATVNVETDDDRHEYS